MHSNNSIHLPLSPALKAALIQLSIFLVGFSAMVVAGWYLIEGMLNFAGDESSKRVFIAAGIIFQITESICFIAAAASVSKSLYWRISLFGLGCVLFLFSIAIMTLAQKATLQTGESEAQALDAQITALQAQVASLDNVITGYRFNAEKQSKSVYANSRELGQDSLNRATDLENKKIELSEKLFTLTNTRRQTSSDFFKQLELVVGFPALQMEFYFLMSRSLLLELCGIVLLAFSAYLGANGGIKLGEPGGTSSIIGRNPFKRLTAAERENLSEQERKEHDEHWAKSHIRLLKEKDSDSSSSG